MELFTVIAVVFPAIAALILTLRRRTTGSRQGRCEKSVRPLAVRCRSGRTRAVETTVFPSLTFFITFGLIASAGAADFEVLESVPPNSREPHLDIVMESSSGPADWKDREVLLGEFGGLRPWLADLGISLELASVDEGFSHASGGSSGDHGFSYHGMTDLVISLNTDEAGLWRGGTFLVDLQNVRGGDISECLGDVQGVSNIVGPSGTRFVEYFFEQTSAGGHFRLKFGKQDANADFIVTESSADFLNSSFGLVPTVPIPTFPAPALGLMAGWQVSDRTEIKAGIWDGASELGSECFDTAFDGVGGTVSAVEIESLLFGGNILPATLKFGVWHQSEVESAAKMSGTESATGAYLSYDQNLWRGQQRSVDVFFQGGWSDPNSAAISGFIGLGAVVQNPFTATEGEALGLAFGRASIGKMEGVHAHGTDETVIEAFYAFPLTPWVTLKPDLQLVRVPHTRGQASVVVGLRMETRF